jgi:hypothetical protein
MGVRLTKSLLQEGKEMLSWLLSPTGSGELLARLSLAKLGCAWLGLAGDRRLARQCHRPASHRLISAPPGASSRLLQFCYDLFLAAAYVSNPASFVTGTNRGPPSKLTNTACSTTALSRSHSDVSW